MKIMKLLKNLPLITLFMVLGCNPAWATVGRVLYTMGNVTVEKPAEAYLRRGDTVDAGDVIVTGKRSYVQVKLDDGSKIAIRPSSRFTIEEVEMPATATTPAIGAGTSLRASFSLQRGGFRTITGRIAKRNPGAYRVTTPSAIIGVRGTNYSARYCQGDCGTSPAQSVDDGLYIGVSDGTVSMSNNGGELDLATNQYGFAQNFNTPPERLIAPPSALTSDGLAAALEEEEEGEDSDEGDESEDSDESSDSDDSSDSEESSDDDSTSEDSSSDESAEESEDLASQFSSSEDVAEVASTADETTVTGTTTTVTEADQEITATTESGAAVDLTDGGSSAVTQPLAFALSGLTESGNSPSVETDTGGNLVGFQSGSSSTTDDATNGSTATTVSYAIGTASTFNAGNDSVTSVKWGRWSEGVAEQIVESSTSQLDLSGSSLHWILAPTEDLPTQEITGTASYVLVGNTDPTDNQGNIGVLGSADLMANFTTSTVTNHLQLGINNQVWTASGDGQITTRLFSGLYSTVAVDGSSGGTGSFAGAFTNFSSTTLPGGAGMTYDLSNGTININGAAVFNRSDD